MNHKRTVTMNNQLDVMV